MKSKRTDQNQKTKCNACRSTNMLVDEFNPEDWEWIGDAEFAERELGNHGTLTCLDCGHQQEFDL
jgi:hypothetical protein